MNPIRTLRADEIEVRVARVSANGAFLLLYKDARCDMNILDETFGPMNWQRIHSRDNANCTILIWDSEKGQWISKEDTGTESNTEAEKGLASDSFKRSAVNVGIGRELYTAPKIWVSSDVAKINNGKCNDDFVVRQIEYDDRRNISFLEIFDDTTHKIAFKWGERRLVCEHCKKAIGGVVVDGKTYAAEDIAANAIKKYGKQLCAACSKKEAAKVKKEEKPNE